MQVTLSGTFQLSRLFKRGEDKIDLEVICLLLIKLLRNAAGVMEKGSQMGPLGTLRYGHICRRLRIGWLMERETEICVVVETSDVIVITYR
jgi:hypothetical protein